jgi:predicted AAA+ superfamily ATPase
VLNRTDLAAPLGISVPTVNEWLNALELTGQIVVVQPYFENFGKRLTKSPKVYYVDSGLVCHLLGIRSQSELDRSPFLGAIFEGFVASEILKSQVNGGGRKQLYYFRDQQGLEVDFLVPSRGEELWMIECKATRTVQPSMANPLVSLSRAMHGAKTRAMVVHRASSSPAAMRALVPGVEALPVEALVERLAGGRRPRRPKG